jgi:hypothetical protein
VYPDIPYVYLARRILEHSCRGGNFREAQRRTPHRVLDLSTPSSKL